ncbi:hypothetical protein D1872_289290 [compost metagenome]
MENPHKCTADRSSKQSSNKRLFIFHVYAIHGRFGDPHNRRQPCGEGQRFGLQVFGAESDTERTAGLSPVGYKHQRYDKVITQACNGADNDRRKGIVHPCNNEQRHRSANQNAGNDRHVIEQP